MEPAPGVSPGGAPYVGGRGCTEPDTDAFADTHQNSDGDTNPCDAEPDSNGHPDA
jgi:hypothetical protein